MSTAAASAGTHVALLVACIGLSGCPTQQTVVGETANSAQVLSMQQQAERAYAERDWANAEPLYRQLVSLVPQDGALWFRLGNVYARLNRPDAAIDAYRESLVRDPSNVKAWNNMGIVHLRQAAHTFSELHRYTDETDPLNERGRLYFGEITRLLQRNARPGSTETDE